MKSGAAIEGSNYNKPTKNVYVTNNEFSEGAGLAIGSETSGNFSEEFSFSMKYIFFFKKRRDLQHNIF
jgi:hypothetical protein